MANVPPLIPCLFERRLLPKPWGGQALAHELGMTLPAGEGIGESWEVFHRGREASALRDDPEGRTLADLMDSHREELLGGGVATGPGGTFPLILKYIDAAAPLSVQVHPGHEQAAEDGDGPKEEAWLVIAAGRDARIVRGFRDGVDAERVASAAGTAEIEEMLHDFTPRAGDVLHMPPGTVHSVGPDVVIFEVQQNSELTYRFWDWGSDRELHVERALRAMDVGTPARPEYVAPRALGPGEELLLQAKAFRMRRRTIDQQTNLATDGRFLLVTVRRGNAVLGWRSGGEHPPLPIRPGDTALVPACIDEVFVSPIGATELLLTDTHGDRA